MLLFSRLRTVESAMTKTQTRKKRIKVLVPMCENCDCPMFLIAEERSNEGFMFECKECRMPEVVFN